MTKIKLFFGRILYRIVHLIYREDRRIIVRNGIKYEVDLSEGVDLSMFLFGSFQRHVSQNKRLSLFRDAVIFDVGANFGLMTLQFAKLVPLGKVYAFEPTSYAFSRLKRNLELNPELAERVVPIQNFVSSNICGEPDIRAYASWKVGGKVTDVKHEVHGGTAKSAGGVGGVSLDDFCEENKIKTLDFMKIDTDGHEFEVLKGGQKVIGKFRPIIIFEIGVYLMEEKHIDFSDYLKFFDSLNYSLSDSNNLKEINASNYYEHIPSKATIDILATPITHRSINDGH
jgi:FkbM family methyltransferase